MTKRRKRWLRMLKQRQRNRVRAVLRAINYDPPAPMAEDYGREYLSYTGYTRSSTSTSWYWVYSDKANIVV